MTAAEFTTANGIAVLADSKPHWESVAVVAGVRAGARNETAAQNGISHVLEHMAFKGTATRTAFDIAAEIESVGGHLNASTSKEHTLYIMSVLKADIGRVLAILPELLLHPSLDETELVREKAVIAQEIKAGLDNPGVQAANLLFGQAWPDQPLGRPVAGTEELVESFAAADLRQYMDTHYRAGNLVVAAAGDIDAAWFAEQVERGFAALPAGEPPAAAPADYRGGRAVENRETLNKLDVVLGFEGLPAAHPDRDAFDVGASILGSGMTSRLFQNVREKLGLCYAIGAGSAEYRDTGLLAVSAAVSPDKVNELLEAAVAEIRRMAETEVSADELARAKSRQLSGYLRGTEKPATRVAQLVAMHFTHGRYVPKEEIVADVEKVTAADVQRVMAAAVTGGKPAMAAVGPTDGLTELDKIEEMLRPAKQKGRKRKPFRPLRKWFGK